MLFAKNLDQITEALKARSLQSSPQALTWVIIVVHATAKDSVSILAWKGVGLVDVCVCVCVCVCARVHMQGKYTFLHVLYQFSSVTQSCPTLCNPMDCSTPGLPVHHQLPEFTQTHVHRVSDAIQPSHPLSYPSPLTFNLSQHQVLFQGVSSSSQK